VKRHKIVALGVLAIGLLAGCDGKGTAGTCTTYGACGGDAKGDWTLAAGCENLIVSPYQQPSLLQQQQTTQVDTIEPPQPATTTSGDWCSQLVYEPSTNPTMPVQGVVLWHPPATVYSGYLHALADGTYSAQIEFRDQVSTYFPNACLTRYESVAPSCTKLGTDLETYLLNINPDYKFGASTMACTGDSSVGCTCSYAYQDPAGQKGTWHVDPADTTSIVFASTGTSEPQASSFCQTGNTLELSGQNGTDVFGVSGLRSVMFTRDTTP
jgi:hypothetical protein